ncbi:FixH family protein [Chondrinema litorale]|uniref:FixH family protein n=1 Tax=Chondrinema litorale TaxID=2994555 RepID=UPI0025436F54|nr:FixH family protein [Chondrinema litorale]UZR93229.1 FixH family protein [Chondrinema litorale]
MSTFKFHWGYGIALFFSSFVAFILFAVFSSTKENIHLVTEDYYAEELAYQNRIDEIKNTNSLNSRVSMRMINEALEISFPTDMVGKDLEGSIYLFRPSDSGLDKQFDIAINEEGLQQINTDKITKGYYRVKLEWEMDGKSYFVEEPFYIQ